MDILFLIFVVGGSLVAIISSIALLVIAFRLSIGWFIVCFLPFGKLVFAIAHWQEVRGTVLAYFVGVAMILAGLVFDPRISEDDSNPLRGINRVFRSGKKEAPPLSAPAKALVTREERITMLEAQVAKDTADLNASFRELSARRAALKPGDEKALADYNNGAARYAALLELTRKAKAELDALTTNPK